MKTTALRRWATTTVAVAATVTLTVTAAAFGGALADRAGAGSPAAAQHVSAADAADAANAAAGHGHWVDTWTSMPQLTEPGNMPPAPYTQDGAVFADTTLRQTVHVTLGGRTLRLHLSNAFGGAVLPVTAVSVARPVDGRSGARAIVPGSARQVTFGGRPGTTVPVGAQMVADPLDFPVAAGETLTVTIYLATGQQSTNITSHPGSRTTSYMLRGDHLDDADLDGAASVNHWYFLSAVEVQAPATDRATVVLGDSLADGRGSTDNGDDRWPDRLRARLAQHADTAGTAVLNQAAGGNRVLNDGLGPNALSRLDRDVFAQPGVTSLIVSEGVNDIGTADATAAAQQAVTADLINAYRQIVLRAHAQGIPVYGATLTPFGGHQYDDAAGLREASRQAVNDWIRTSGQFDAVLDFDRAVRDPQAPRRLRSDLDVGDHLHFNPTGYQALADSVPLRLFGPGAR
ncbi:SGNH hydrolase [Kitasatospora phosalacinea]|uniref:SGNH hydrolase n=1 Tax=Kitasatospora phosalacinea TaxID=2065 RepID=A0A9W6V4Z8_9ACTN|nr:SGNH/GDSL hydrolase family protein [Kitasatospora phosalacinea]GLW72737.1 SGNH hydrolase [Kitasatospora phosalacinea]